MIQFSEAAKLFARNKALVDRMDEVFRQETITFIRDQLSPAVRAAVEPRTLQAYNTGTYMYWCFAEESLKKAPTVPCIYAPLCDAGLVNGSWTAWGYWQDGSSPLKRAQLRAQAMALATDLGADVELEGTDGQHMFTLNVTVGDATTPQSIAAIVGNLLTAISDP